MSNRSVTALVDGKLTDVRPIQLKWENSRWNLGCTISDELVSVPLDKCNFSFVKPDAEIPKWLDALARAFGEVSLRHKSDYIRSKDSTVDAERSRTRMLVCLDISNALRTATDYFNNNNKTTETQTDNET